MWIGLESVSYHYETDQPILKNCTISIERGQSVALVGANGCGKTTAIRLLGGIQVPAVGYVVYQGESLTKEYRNKIELMKRFHQQVGVVFQKSDTQLFCSTVYEEIAFGPRQMGLSESQVQERVKDMAELLGIEALLQAVPYHLSGGQQKKVALAAVLSVNPEVILLDEPLAALDPRTQSLVMHVFQLLRDAGKTLVIATHDLQRLPQMVDRVIVFNEAHQIVADDIPEVILQQVELLKAVNLVGEDYHVHIHRHGNDEEMHIHL